MISVDLAIDIEPIAALRLHCVVTAQAWSRVRSATLPRNSSSLERLRESRIYGRTVAFFTNLPHENPVDIILITAAVIHVDQTLQDLQSWDGGYQTRLKWPEYRDWVIANQLDGQDTLTWARQPKYKTPVTRYAPQGPKSVTVNLQKAADGYLERVLRHITIIRNG